MADLVDAAIRSTRRASITQREVYRRASRVTIVSDAPASDKVHLLFRRLAQDVDGVQKEGPRHERRAGRGAAGRRGGERAGRLR